MQASKMEIQEIVIRVLEAGYRPLKSKEREPVQYGELVDLLVSTIYEREYPPAALKAGMKVFRVDWMQQRWPTAGELIHYFDAARDVGTPPPVITRKPDEEAWADKVMTLPEGQEALREGYARELYLWAERNPGTVPNGIVMENCRRADLEFRATLQQLIQQARNHAPTAADGNLGTHALSSALKAAGQMQGFETQLRRDFAQVQQAAE